ncbi:MAG: hypothetical protein IPF72_05965 [Chitinophagaceae bacterium]|nr:hypothetical protein [Chitinophagaceae bacterium]
MKKLFIIPALWLLHSGVFAQLPEAMKLPDFVQPTPEVSALLKADNLSVNNSTGSPNINIPIGVLAVNGIKLPINVSYNSTGVRVDEYSSMVGTGWNCSSGGVVSRTIFDRPDEARDGSSYPTNLSNPNFSNQNAALLSFLKDHPDAESDIFSFSFLNYSGKFILDSNLQTIIPLANYNVVIKPISNYFPDGFIITTDDGSTFRFDVAETSKSRNPMGTGCPKTYEASDNITSWYLSKITAPNKRSFMNFTYLTQNILFEQSISQYLSKCIETDNYLPGCGGAALPLNSETFYTCVTRQLVSSKFISKIITSAGDTAAFYYDSSPRQDLDSAKRLSQVRITNRNGLIVKQATLYSSYNSGNGTSSHTNSNKRLYLDSIKLDNIGDTLNSIPYKFDYIDKSGVSARLTYLQDWYGYSNGKSSNASLIPTLPTTDMNYPYLGGGSTLVTYGDRSIDTVYAMKGLLNKIIYPTGGYDSIIYRPNRYYNGGNDSLIGGSSVTSIQSYSFGQKELEKSFSYLDTSNHSSTFLLTGLNRCSDQTKISKDWYFCGTVICEGPWYKIAHLSSNLQVPLTTLGSQHAYHRNVIEKTVGSTNNGYTEHHYLFFNGGNLGPYDISIGHNNKILSAPLQVVNDVVLGEDLTKIYRYDTATSSYKLQKSVTNYLFMHNFLSYYNYVIKKNFLAGYNSTPPTVPCEFNPFDVTKYAINKYDVYTDSTREVTYDNNNDSFIVKTTTEYANSLHSYPTKQIVNSPDGDILEIRKTYPLDGSASVLTYRNIVAPVLEEKKYKNSTLLSTITNTYDDWFNDSTVVVLQQTEYKEQTNSMPAHINYINYDTLANVLEIAKDSGVHKSYLWGYKKQLPIAAATNAAANEIFYTSFEEVDGTTDAVAKTGGKSHSGNYSVSFLCPMAKATCLLTGAGMGPNGCIMKQLTPALQLLLPHIN